MTAKFPNLPGLDIQSTLDGAARKRWEEHENPRLPRHLIRHDVDHLECTCGYVPTDMNDWSEHATRVVDGERKSGSSTVC